MIRWETDGYAVAFTTRVGGVSEGPYASLNLGRKSGDDVAHVDENRRIACAAIAADLETLALNYQVHSDRVLRAAAGMRGERARRALDGTNRACRSSPCPRIACPSPSRVSTRAHRPLPSSTPAGAACSPASSPPARKRSAAEALAAAIGPAIGPCCYEVGEEVAAPFRERFGADVVRGRPPRPLDERRAGAPRGRRRSRRSLRPLHRLRARDLLLAPARCGPHRPPGSDRLRRRLRSASATSESGTRSAPASPSWPRRSTSRSTTWLRWRRPASRWSARIARRTCEAKHDAYGDAFRWHFIGHLQSRKAPLVSELCELCHSLASESAAKKLTIPALVEVNLSGEATKSGVAPRSSPTLLEAYPDVRGLMTMPPATADPEASRPYFRRLRELAERARPARALDGDEPGLPDRRRGGSDLRPGRRSPMAALTSAAPCRFPTSGARTLVYFGIAEEEDWDEDGYLTEDELAEGPSARTCAVCRRAVLDRPTTTTGPTRSPTGQRTSILRPRSEPRRARNLAAPCKAREPLRVHLILPRSFNDAQQVADRFKNGVPVILNLQSADTGAVEAADRLRERPHVCARRRDAADRRQGLPPDAQRCRVVRRGSRADARGGASSTRPSKA